MSHSFKTLFCPVPISRRVASQQSLASVALGIVMVAVLNELSVS